KDGKLNLISKIISWIKDKLSKSLKAKQESIWINQGYLYEIIGLVLGSVCYFWVLIFFHAVTICFLVAVFNLIILLFLTKSARVKWLYAAVIILILVLPVTSLFDYLEKTTAQWRFSGQILIKDANYAYGNVSVVYDGQKYNFYVNGLNVGNSGNSSSNEALVHFAMLYHQRPRSVLLVGGGFSDALYEVLKYPITSIDYLEFDPQLIRLSQNYLSEKSLLAQRDKKVKIIYQDIRRFIAQTQNKYDVIILNLAAPSTISLNRLYTTEFFRQLKSRLSPDGIVSTHLSVLADYNSNEFKNLVASLYKSLADNYSNTFVIPEDSFIYLATDRKFDYNREPVLKRFYSYQLDNNLITSDYIKNQLTENRIDVFLKPIIENNKAKINSDLQPALYWYQALFWLSENYSTFGKLITGMSRINFNVIFTTFLIIFIFVFWLLDIFVKRKEKLLALVTIFPDFSLLATELIFIFLWQVLFGQFYYQVALVFTLALLGMALGVRLASSLIVRKKAGFGFLIIVYLLICVYFLLWWLGLIYWPTFLAIKLISVGLIFLVCFLVGMEFPLTNKLYLDSKNEPDKKIGTIYGADLIGASFGAVVTGSLLIPVLGIVQTVAILFVLNFFILALIFFLRQGFMETD
ncbi:MAG: MnmC family methyltransferase, partial [Patescibacteria group bacterium]|nr:MnmC family methyltransferase [Patescibacteria group bacterium]